MAAPERTLADGRVAIYRHPLLVRLTHWIMAASLLVALFSGLQILNAHPALYWGEVSRFDRAFLAVETADGEAGPTGWLRVGAARLETTGVLGVSAGEAGEPEARAFPRWLTLPAALDLGAGRQWHFAAAWLLVASLAAWLAYNLAAGRLRRELWPSRADLAGFGAAVRDHLRLRFDHAARRYNVLQKLAYLAVGVVILPLMVLSGLAMSPSLDALLPLSEMFGGRQTARSLHFFGAAALVLYLLVHVAMVLAAGPVNEMRTILTGWFVVRPGKTP